MQNMQHQAVYLVLRPLFQDLSLKRGALSSSSSARTKVLLPLQADRRRPGTNGPAWPRRPGRRSPSGPAVELAAVRLSGLALLLPAAAAAERKGARGMRRGPEVRGRAGRKAGSRMIWHPRAELKCAGMRGEGGKLCARDGPRP